MKLFILFAAATVLAAQPGPPPAGDFAPNVDRAKAYLGLTDAQVTALQAMRKNAEDTLRSTHDDLRAKTNALHQLVQSGSTETASITSLQTQIQADRKQIQQSINALVAQSVQMLDPAAKTKLQALVDAATLQSTIHEAVMLGLLAPQGPPPGPRGDGPHPPPMN